MRRSALPNACASRLQRPAGAMTSRGAVMAGAGTRTACSAADNSPPAGSARPQEIASWKAATGSSSGPSRNSRAGSIPRHMLACTVAATTRFANNGISTALSTNTSPAICACCIVSAAARASATPPNECATQNAGRPLWVAISRWTAGRSMRTISSQPARTPVSTATPPAPRRSTIHMSRPLPASASASPPPPGHKYRRRLSNIPGSSTTGDP